MTLLYAIDPGARKAKNRASYLAVFYACELVLARAITYEDARTFDSPDVLVAEKPQQDGRSSNVPPSTLIKLSWYGGQVIGALRAKSIVEYEPNDWAGQSGKPDRHIKLWRVLSPLERKCFPPDTEERIKKGVSATARAGELRNYSFDAHNLLDACGIGLFHLKRIGKGGAIVGRRPPVKRTTFADIDRAHKKALGQ